MSARVTNGRSRVRRARTSSRSTARSKCRRKRAMSDVTAVSVRCRANNAERFVGRAQEWIHDGSVDTSWRFPPAIATATGIRPIAAPAAATRAIRIPVFCISSHSVALGSLASKQVNSRRIRVQLRFATTAPLNQTPFGASDRAAAISGHPSPSRSPIASPYTAPLPSFHDVARNVNIFPAP